MIFQSFFKNGSGVVNNKSFLLIKVKMLKLSLSFLVFLSKAYALEVNASFRVENNSPRSISYEFSMPVLVQDGEWFDSKFSIDDKVDVDIDVLGNVFFVKTLKTIAPYSTYLINLNWSVGTRKLDKVKDDSLQSTYLPMY